MPSSLPSPAPSPPAAEPPAGPIIDRLVEADAKAALKALEGSPLIEQGRVNLIGLDSIVRRLGPRWPLRKDQVHEHVAKVLERRLGHDGYFVRASDADYLVVHPDLNRFSAQAACFGLMREVLTHFLGEAEPGDMAVREVTSVAGSGLEAHLVAPNTPVAGGAFEARGPVAGEGHSFEPRPVAAPVGPAVASDYWSAFVASDGRPLRVSCVLEPCFRLEEARQIGFRIHARVVDGMNGQVLPLERQGQLTSADIERVDMAAISRGMDRLRLEFGKVAPPMLILPASYATIMTRSGRSRLLSSLKEASDGLTSRVICEIRSIEGVPGAMVFDACSVLRPWCYAVVGALDRLADLRVRAWSGAGLNGVAFPLRDTYDTTPDLFAALAGGVAAAKRAARSVVVHGLRSPHDLVLARLAGATHASLAGPLPPEPAPAFGHRGAEARAPLPN